MSYNFSVGQSLVLCLTGSLGKHHAPLCAEMRAYYALINVSCNSVILRGMANFITTWRISLVKLKPYIYEI